ncbi:DUF4226 domain-containing protein [Mycobacterium paragordonae]|uniref:DUF4226 domain-containing protein n=1 Tax=Mycobacterium paragordonae TaxID=1389713 RepID=UPI0012E31D39|nr:DUF4226 domain-containing protein [Mycobacterium paragordonae]
MGFLEDLEHLLSPILAGVDELFGGDDARLPPRERARDMLPAPPWLGGPARTVGPSWGGSGGLHWGADQAAGTYEQSSGALAATDDKLAKLLKEIFTANDETRARVSELVAGIEAAHQKMMTDPTMKDDPQALALFNTMLDQNLAEIQRLLNSAKVDSTKQAELLAALGNEYRESSGEHRNGGTDAAGSGGAGSGGGGGAEGGGAAGGGASGVDPGAGATGGVTDPLAGMGGLPGMMGDPTSMLGPALGALGSLPGMLGGAGGSLPMDALGALAPLAGAMGNRGGSGEGFNDESRERDKPADVVDDHHGHDEGPEASGGHGKGESDGKADPAAAGSAGAPPVAAQPAAVAAAPASAPGGDASLVVQMPDGTPVTATSAQHAAVMRAVLNGASVTDAWKPYAQLPPPGTPVTMPADPNHLLPGQVAQCKSREPIIFMGNGKIWLDGQLQPQSALPAAEFLGWEDPTQFAAGTIAHVPAAAAPSVSPPTVAAGA